MAILSSFGPWPSGVFYTGGAVVTSDIVPAAYPVAIAGHPYNIEPKLYRKSHVPMRRQATDESAEPGEATLSTEGLWRRSQSDWSLGAGQLWLDEEESTRRRFNQSLGMDVFNDRAVTLLPATEEKLNSAASNMRLLEVGTRLYALEGANLRFSDASSSEQNATWSTGWTSATGLPAGNLLDIVYSGSFVYVLASDNSIYRAAPGAAAFALWYNPAAVATRLYTGIGRLFMSDGRTLYEVTAVPGETTIFQHPDPNFVYSALVAGPTGLYVGGNIGDFGEIRYTKINAAGTGFDPPAVAAEFYNETVQALVTAGNNLLIGTSVGFRYAPIENLSSGLNFGPAVEVGTVRDLVVESVINPSGRLDTFVWFTWANIHGLGSSGLGRIRLTRFTEPLVPAYASDIFMSGGTPMCVASIRGRRYFGVATDGFYGATENPVAEAWLSTGRIRYGVLDSKNFSDLKWRSEPLSGTITASVTFDTGNVSAAGAQTAVDSVSNDFSSIGPVIAEWAEITFTMTRGGVAENAMVLGAITENATTPDNAAFAVTDLEVIVRVALDSWVVGGFGSTFLSQWGAAGNQGWFVGLDPTGKPTISWSNDGTATLSLAATTALPYVPGEEAWLRYRLDVDNGAGGRTATFEISDDGVTWSLFESVTAGATTTIFNSTSALGIGTLLPVLGKVYFVQMSASIGGAAVANPDFSNQPASTTSFTDAAGRTWTLNAGASIDVITVAADLAPVLRWWVMRAIPSPESTIEFLVPLRLYSQEQTPLGSAKVVDFLGELEFLDTLVSAHEIVRYQEGLRSYDVYVNNVEMAGSFWNNLEHGLEGICVVQMHTINPT